jgi:hypothetical protein
VNNELSAEDIRKKTKKLSIKDKKTKKPELKVKVRKSKFKKKINHTEDGVNKQTA